MAIWRNNSQATAMRVSRQESATEAQRRRGKLGSLPLCLCVSVAAFALCLLLPASLLAQAQPAKSSCVECHAAFPAPTGVTEEQWATDIHAQKGLTCAACH